MSIDWILGIEATNLTDMDVDLPTPQVHLSLTKLSLCLTQTNQLVREIISCVLEQFSIEETPYLLLVACYQSEAHPASQKELAKILAISPAQICTIVEDLRQQGLILGQRDPRDRRRQVWQLTEPGKQLLLKSEQAMVHLLQESNNQLFSTLQQQLTSSKKDLETSLGSISYLITQERKAA